MRENKLKPPTTIQKVTVISEENVGEAQKNPYLSVHRLSLQNTYADGSQSTVYPYDAVLRKWLDAVVIILTSTINNRTHVLLRSAIRPPLLLRNNRPIPFPEVDANGILWELPAGLLEDDDVGDAGIIQRAQIEILEETGYHVDTGAISQLRGAPYLSAGTIPERLWYTMAEVTDPADRTVPKGDGSPVEENAQIQWLELESAIRLCDDGQIDDLKTELGIRRLASIVNV